MIYSEIPSAQILVLLFKSRGVKNIVISPGSRNAPLTLSFSKNPDFNCFSIVDERCAAFFAMGMARQLQEPVAVLCTSGSALLNYFPAVAEACYSEIPLIVVSADRPEYKIDVGDGQTIRQKNVFGDHVGYSANLKLDVCHSTQVIRKFAKDLLLETQEQVEEFNQIELCRALDLAFHQKKPVHINIPFEEPLYGQTDMLSVEVHSESPLTHKPDTPFNISKYDEIWTKTSKKMVLIGVQQPNILNEEVIELLGSDSDVLVFTETTSNTYHANFFPSIDCVVAPIEKSSKREELFGKLKPEVLITMGGMIVSKKIKAFLRDYRPKHHWHLGNTRAYDTFFCLDEHIDIDPNRFFSNLTSTLERKGYRTFWDGIMENYKRQRSIYLKRISFSDFWAFDKIQSSIPSQYQVHLANSSTVRYSQLFEMNASLQVFCNRGTSGIDGSTSSAIGAAEHYAFPTLLITGDLSFFYDSNGLWYDGLRKDFRIILINNTGGGIFRILPGSEETSAFSKYFETVHGLTAENLSKMHNFQYQSASSKAELLRELEDFYEPSDRPKILEVFTPRVKNDKILLDYFDFIS